MADPAQERLKAGCPAWGPGSGYVHVSAAELDGLIAERDRMRTWDGVLAFLDERYPTDVFPVQPDDDGRDAGPRILSLIRRLAKTERAITAARVLRVAWLAMEDVDEEWDDATLAKAHEFMVALRELDGEDDDG